MNINISTKVVAGYTVDEYGVLRNAPCGCYQCSEQGWQKGHPYCDEPTPELLAAEERGEIYRQLDGSWHWRLA